MQDADKNPVTDNDPGTAGERASQGQGVYHVWFLPGAIRSDVRIKRTCTVPSDTEILILTASSDSSYLEHKEAKYDNQLLEIAREIAKLHEDVEITIEDEDGNKETFGIRKANQRQEGELELIETPAFPIIFPSNNIYREVYKVPGGYTHIAAVAWGIKVKLKPGVYKVTCKAHHPAATVNVGGLTIRAEHFKLDVEYTVKAIEENQGLKLPFLRSQEEPKQ